MKPAVGVYFSLFPSLSKVVDDRGLLARKMLSAVEKNFREVDWWEGHRWTYWTAIRLAMKDGPDWRTSSLSDVRGFNVLEHHLRCEY